MYVSAVVSFLTRAAADTVVDARKESMSSMLIGATSFSPKVSRRAALIERMRSEILDSMNARLVCTMSNVSVCWAGGYEKANDATGGDVKEGRIKEEVAEEDEEVAEEVDAIEVDGAEEDEEVAEAEDDVVEADDEVEEEVGRERALLMTRCRAVSAERVERRKRVRGTVVGESRIGSNAASLPDETLPGSLSSEDSSPIGSSPSQISWVGCLRSSTLLSDPSSHTISRISALQLGQVDSVAVQSTIQPM